MFILIRQKFISKFAFKNNSSIYSIKTLSRRSLNLKVANGIKTRFT